jgi:hypothetical protein
MALRTFVWIELIYQNRILQRKNLSRQDKGRIITAFIISSIIIYPLYLPDAFKNRDLYLKNEKLLDLLQIVYFNKSKW